MGEDERLSWEATFVANMIKARERLGMSQTELARRISSHQQTVQRIEQRTRSPRLDEAQAIAGVLFGGRWDEAIAAVTARTLHQLVNDEIERLDHQTDTTQQILLNMWSAGERYRAELLADCVRYVEACTSEGVDVDDELLKRADRAGRRWLDFSEWVEAGTVEAGTGVRSGQHQEEA